MDKGNYNANDKGSTYDKFTVKSVSYDSDGNIDGLEVYNSKMKRVVFTYGKKGSNEVKPIPQMQEEPKAPEQEMTAEKAQAQGAYPSREVMLDCAKKHYPSVIVSSVVFRRYSMAIVLLIYYQNIIFFFYLLLFSQTRIIIQSQL